VAKFELDSRKPVVRLVEPGDYRVTLSIKRGEHRTLRVVTVVDRRCTIREEAP
jgi:hypothetical protein